MTPAHHVGTEPHKGLRASRSRCRRSAAATAAVVVLVGGVRESSPAELQSGAQQRWPSAIRPRRRAATVCSVSVSMVAEPSSDHRRRKGGEKGEMTERRHHSHRASSREFSGRNFRAVPRPTARPGGGAPREGKVRAAPAAAARARRHQLGHLRSSSPNKQSKDLRSESRFPEPCSVRMSVCAPRGV